jgi:sulfite reductase (NADPH) flavoprotein alpha-component
VQRVFSYGSNLNARSLRAKGVHVHDPRPAVSPGWSLQFSLVGLFPSDGRMATLLPGAPPAHGVVGELSDAAAAELDRFEARGLRYERLPIEVVTYAGDRLEATAYVALSACVDAGRPTRRYLNLLLEGAREMGLDAAWIDALARTPVHPVSDPGPVTPAVLPERVVRPAELAAHPEWTAVLGVVVDITALEPLVHQFFGGRDVTVFWLQRLDTSDGSETLEEAHAGRLSVEQRAHLRRLQHELLAAGRAVGRYAP